MEWTAVSKKRRVGPPAKEPIQVSTDSRGENPCRKFVVELGDYRTEPEILAELHLRYPWVNLGRRNGMSGNAHLTAKDERSRELLADLRSLNGKTCAFLPLESGTRRTFILMGVPKCITEKLLQDEQVLVAERMTRWDATAKVAVPTDMVKVVLAGKQHPARFTRGYGSYRMRPFVKSPLQCFNCQRCGHTVRTCWRDSQTCRYCAGSHPSSQCKGGQAGHPEVRQLWRGTRHHQPGVFQKANLGQQSQGSTEGRPTTGSDSPDKECLDQKVCTDNGRLSTNFNCRKGTSHTDTYSGGCQATSSKTETRSYQDRSTLPATTDAQCTTPSTEVSRKSAMWSRPKKSIASTGGGTRSDNHRSRRGNSSAEEGLNREKAPYPSSTKDDRGSSRCAQDPLRIEGCAKKGPFQDHGCSPPVGYGNGPFQDHGCSHPNNGPFQDHGCIHHPSCSYNGPFQDHGCSQPVSSDNGPFQDHGVVHPVCSYNGPFQDHGCSTPVCSDNGPFQDHGCSQSVRSDNGPFQGPPWFTVSMLR